ANRAAMSSETFPLGLSTRCALHRHIHTGSQAPEVLILFTRVIKLRGSRSRAALEAAAVVGGDADAAGTARREAPPAPLLENAPELRVPPSCRWLPPRGENTPASLRAQRGVDQEAPTPRLGAGCALRSCAARFCCWRRVGARAGLHCFFAFSLLFFLAL